MSLSEFFSRLMIEVPDHIKSQVLCNEAVEEDPCFLAYTPDRLKIQEMCNRAVPRKPYTLRCISEHLKIGDVQRHNAY